MKNFIAIFMVCAAFACTPANQAEATQIENVVLADLAKGDSLEQIEADVATIVAGKPGADVVVIVNDALQLLVDLGLIPANELPQVKIMIVKLHTVIDTRTAVAPSATH
jgi:hypothetical protein